MLQEKHHKRKGRVGRNASTMRSVALVATIAAAAAASFGVAGTDAKKHCRADAKTVKKLLPIIEMLARSVDTEYGSLKKHAGALCADDAAALVQYKPELHTTTILGKQHRFPINAILGCSVGSKCQRAMEKYKMDYTKQYTCFRENEGKEKLNYKGIKDLRLQINKAEQMATALKSEGKRVQAMHRELKDYRHVASKAGEHAFLEVESAVEAEQEEEDELQEDDLDDLSEALVVGGVESDQLSVALLCSALLCSALLSSALLCSAPPCSALG